MESLYRDFTWNLTNLTLVQEALWSNVSAVTRLKEELVENLTRDASAMLTREVL